jgi:hypothetical protein
LVAFVAVVIVLAIFNKPVYLLLQQVAAFFAFTKDVLDYIADNHVQPEHKSTSKQSSWLTISAILCMMTVSESTVV